MVLAQASCFYLGPQTPDPREQEAWGWACTDKITSLSAGPGGRNRLLMAVVGLGGQCGGRGGMVGTSLLIR